jgi:hypothetical protein
MPETVVQLVVDTVAQAMPRKLQRMSGDSRDMGVSGEFVYQGSYRRIALYQIPPLLKKKGCGSV